MDDSPANLYYLQDVVEQFGKLRGLADGALAQVQRGEVWPRS